MVDYQTGKWLLLLLNTSVHSGANFGILHLEFGWIPYEKVRQALPFQNLKRLMKVTGFKELFLDHICSRSQVEQPKLQRFVPCFRLMNIQDCPYLSIKYYACFVLCKLVPVDMVLKKW